MTITVTFAPRTGWGHRPHVFELVLIQATWEGHPHTVRWFAPGTVCAWGRHHA